MISIIVPVYNSEKYLQDAINSVLSQSYTDWELILIDDGSTDSSGKICDDAALVSQKIKVIHKPNGGPSSARNAGLEIMKGDFLIFLDGDDLLPANTLETFVNIGKKHDKSVVSGKIIKFSTPSSVKISSEISFEVREITSHEAIERILYQDKLDNSMSGKMFPAHLWRDMRFREGSFYEDLDIFYRIFLKTDRIISADFVAYLYRQHPESYVHTFSLKRKDILSVTGRLVDYVEQEIPLLLPAARSRQISANFNMLMLTASNYAGLDEKTKLEADKIIDECWRKIKELRFQTLINGKVRLKNKFGIMMSYLGGKPLLTLLGRLSY